MCLYAAFREHGIGFQESGQVDGYGVVDNEQDALVITNCPTVRDNSALQVAQRHRRGCVLSDAVAVTGKIALQKCFDPLAFNADDACVGPCVHVVFPSYR